jgi:PAS domain-containing protein
VAADVLTSVDLEAVVESAADAIVMADALGVICGWNRAAGLSGTRRHWW